MTGPANNDHKSLPDSTCRLDVDTGLFQTTAPQAPDAGEHTSLATNAAIHIDNTQSFWHVMLLF
jgi:hypothetical protein